MRSVFALILSWLKKIVSLITGKKVVDNNADPIIDPTPYPDVVVYYGCPNSKKAKKLQLDKKAVR